MKSYDTMSIRWLS